MALQKDSKIMCIYIYRFEIPEAAREQRAPSFCKETSMLRVSPPDQAK